MRKKVGIIKRLFCLLLIFLLSINSFAAIVSDNDGSAFITKAEFDALKSSFQSQIDTYNQSIDSKIDGAIASYLAGIKLSNQEEITDKYSLMVSSTVADGYSGVYWSGVETTAYGTSDTDIYPSMDMRIFSIWGNNNNGQRYGWLFNPYLKKTYNKVVLNPTGYTRWAGVSEMIYSIRGTYFCGYNGNVRTSIDLGFPDHNLTGDASFKWLQTPMETEDEVWGYNDTDTPYLLNYKWRDDSSDKKIIFAPFNNKNTVTLDEQIAGPTFTCGHNADMINDIFASNSTGTTKLANLKDNVSTTGDMYLYSVTGEEGKPYIDKGYSCSGKYYNTTWWIANRNFVQKSGMAGLAGGKNLEFKSYSLHHITNRTSEQNFAKLKYEKVKSHLGQDASAATGIPICDPLLKEGKIEVTATFDYSGWGLVYAKPAPDLTWDGNRTNETDTTSIKVTAHQVPKDTPKKLTCDCEAGDTVYIVYVPNTGEDWTKLATLTIQQIVLITSDT